MDFFGLDIDLLSDVYVPREDTYLLLNVLEDKISDDYKVLDIGTGTGLIALFAAEMCQEVVGVDINDKAVNLAKHNASKNKIENVRFIQSNLFEEVEGRFDLVVFNPPYLPGNGYDEKIPGSEQWFGGEDGISVIRDFSKEVENHLSESGTILLLISSVTGLRDTKDLFVDGGFEVEVVKKKKIPWETLFVLEISPKTQKN